MDGGMDGCLYMHIYIYIFICLCVFVCVGSACRGCRGSAGRERVRAAGDGKDGYTSGI